MVPSGEICWAGTFSPDRRFGSRRHRRGEWVSDVGLSLGHVRLSWCGFTAYSESLVELLRWDPSPARTKPQALGAFRLAMPPGATPRRTPAAATPPSGPRESCRKTRRAGNRRRRKRPLLLPPPPRRRPPRRAGVRERGRRCRDCAFLSTLLWLVRRQQRGAGEGGMERFNGRDARKGSVEGVEDICFPISDDFQFGRRWRNGVR